MVCDICPILHIYTMINCSFYGSIFVNISSQSVSKCDVFITQFDSYEEKQIVLLKYFRHNICS